MSAKPNDDKTNTAKKSTAMRDAAIMASVLAVMTVGYVLIRQPQALPGPGMNQSMGGQQGQMQRGGVAPDPNMLPTDYAGLVRAGNQMMDQDQYMMAAEAYRRALAIDDSDPAVRADFGSCLHAMGLPHRALEEFRKVLQVQPDHAIVNFNMGVVHYEEGTMDSARYYFERYLELDPSGQAADMAKNLIQRMDE